MLRGCHSRLLKSFGLTAVCVAALLALPSGVAYAGDAPAIVWQQSGHTESVDAVAFSADEQMVASGASDGDATVRIWNANNGGLVHVLPGHHLGVKSLDFSADGNYVAAGHAQISSTYPVQFGVVYVWDLNTEQIVQQFSGAFVKFSADGSRLLSAGWGVDRNFRVHSMPEGAEIANVNTGSYVTAATLSDDGLKAATGRYEGLVQLWNVNSGSQIRTFDHGGPVRALAFSPNGALFASAGEGDGSVTVKLWNASTGALVRVFDGGDLFVTDIDFSADNATLVSCGSDESYYRVIRVWRVSDGTQLDAYDQNTNPFVNSVAIAGSGEHFVYGRGDGMVAVASVTPATAIGDLNCDGVSDNFDIDPFVLVLTSASETPAFGSYNAMYPGCNPLNADIDGDGSVSNFDIDPFVALLTGG